jgi:phosphate starvation-inducible PhoH-like protein
MAGRVLKKINDIGFCYLSSSDVVRHPLVQKIVQAYDDYESKKKPEGRKSKTSGGRKARHDD